MYRRPRSRTDCHHTCPRSKNRNAPIYVIVVNETEMEETKKQTVSNDSDIHSQDCVKFLCILNRTDNEFCSNFKVAQYIMRGFFVSRLKEDIVHMSKQPLLFSLQESLEYRLFNGMIASIPAVLYTLWYFDKNEPPSILSTSTLFLKSFIVFMATYLLFYLKRLQNYNKLITLYCEHTQNADMAQTMLKAIKNWARSNEENNKCISTIISLNLIIAAYDCAAASSSAIKAVNALLDNLPTQSEKTVTALFTQREILKAYGLSATTALEECAPSETPHTPCTPISRN